MKTKLFTLKSAWYMSAFVAVFLLFAFVNLAAYSPQNELAVFAPRATAMSDDFKSYHSWQIATLDKPTLDKPTLGDAPTLDKPTLDKPTLDKPTLGDAPTLDKPTLGDKPTLDKPTLGDAPTLDKPTLDKPTLDKPDNVYKKCDISANTKHVQYGSSVTIGWNTTGFDHVKLNGQNAAASGSKTFTVDKDTTYKLVAKTYDGKSDCSAEVKVICIPKLPSCTLQANPSTITKGDTAQLKWTTTNASHAYLNRGIGSVDTGTNRTLTVNPSDTTTYTMTVKNQAGKTDTCITKVKVEKESTPEPVQPTCPLHPKENRTIVDLTGDRIRSDKGLDRSRTALHPVDLPAGEYRVTLFGWDGYTNRVNATQPNERWQLSFLAHGEEVALSNSTKNLQDRVLEASSLDVVNDPITLAKDVAYVRGVHAVYPDTSSANSLNPICAALDYIPPAPEPKPVCVAFTANPSTITKGNSTTLHWDVKHATKVTIDRGVGTVDGKESQVVTPLGTTLYTLTVFGAEGKTDTCTAKVKVEEESTPKLPSCTLQANPSTITKGDTAQLKWTTTNASHAYLNRGIGSVDTGTNRTLTVNPSDTTTYTMTVKNQAGKTDTCITKVKVEKESTPEPITCEDNVTFSASPKSITRGNSSTLTWSTTGLTSVNISGVSATALSGSAVVSPSSNTTYTLNGSDGEKTISCPVTVSVSTGSTGGGGGGSVSPRCILDVSDTRITAGEEVRLTWSSRNARDIEITDSHGATIVTTQDRLFSAKEALLSGARTVAPKETTTYTMRAERGRSVDECTVRVRVDDADIVVLEERDQQPLVSGIALTQVPYTGFEAGPILTMLFYTLLTAWALFVAFVIVRRRQALATSGVLTDTAATDHATLQREVNPDLFPTVAASTTAATAPTNLPTFTPASVQQQPVFTETVPVETTATIADGVLDEFEAQAHEARVLISRDALTTFVAHTDEHERSQHFAAFLDDAAASYPAEDGWVVLNQPRVHALLG